MPAPPFPFPTVNGHQTFVYEVRAIRFNTCSLLPRLPPFGSPLIRSIGPLPSSLFFALEFVYGPVRHVVDARLVALDGGAGRARVDGRGGVPPPPGVGLTPCVVSSPRGMDYVHDPALYPHFPGGYDDVLVRPVLGLKPHHLPITVKLLHRDLFPPV